MNGKNQESGPVSVEKEKSLFTLTDESKTMIKTDGIQTLNDYLKYPDSFRRART
jgi:hypothetical protein